MASIRRQDDRDGHTEHDKSEGDAGFVQQHHPQVPLARRKTRCASHTQAHRQGLNFK